MTHGNRGAGIQVIDTVRFGYANGIDPIPDQSQYKADPSSAWRAGFRKAAEDRRVT
jgi:hypothetical protein